VGTTLGEGDIFWGIAFFIENAPMPVLLQAAEDSQVLLWSRETMEPILNQHGSMSWHLSQLAIKRMQQASGIVEELAFQPVMSRLAGLLLDTFGDADDQFKARELTLDDMAARIGTTREMVCRHLYKFADKGAIEIRRTELRIANRDILENQAKKH
jgi:CRP/FNR family transcriptional regulator